MRLQTFAGLRLTHDDGSSAPRVRPPRLALLAALAGAGERGVSRERLMAIFWPDSDDAHGRHSVRQALYALRQDLGREVVTTHGTALLLDRSAITTDVAEFRDAVSADERARAAAIATGPFLDGFYLPGAPEFEQWVEEERARLTATLAGVLTSLANDATRARDHDAAVASWRRLTDIDPLSGRFAAGYLAALAARGDRAVALAFARQHETLVRRELDADPDPEVRRIEARLRASATPAHASPSFGSSSPAAESGIATDRSTAMAAQAPPPNVTRRRYRPSVPRLTLAAGALMMVVVVASAALARQRGWLTVLEPTRTFAVGLIREDGVPDSLRTGRVLTDMLATNLARVNGLPVLANSRVLELMRNGHDSSEAGYTDAARRAGASEIFEGRVFSTSPGSLTLEIRRVELRTGLVTQVYRVNARDRYALVDSMTRSIAEQLRLLTPHGSVAQATTASPMAYRFYEEGLRAFYQFDKKGAKRLMRTALEEDSTFAMAAYYEALLASDDQMTPDGRHVTVARRMALRLAERAPERERLTIAADLKSDENDPSAFAIAETLATKFPDDPRAWITLGKVRSLAGDWPGAIKATERAIALDSATETSERSNCRVCEGWMRLSELYLWSDSLPAAERTARRYLRLRPTSHEPVYQLSQIAARRGDSATAYGAFRQLLAMGATDRAARLDLDLTLEAYDIVDRDVRQLLASSSLHDWGNGAWYYLIALRNQGRLREAVQFHRTGSLPGLPPVTVTRPAPDDYNAGILALERGDPRAATAAFSRLGQLGPVTWPPGVQARNRTWSGTLRATSLAASGDTAWLRALADTVETLGQGSLYGRDRKSHHYVRGLVLAAEGRHAEAVAEYRQAIHSPTLGFTRVNYELGRSLLRLGRWREAIDAVEPALRGEIDASNLYITRTDLHELLAQAFAAAGEVDSAAVHYRAVTSAWVRADPAFHARRAVAREWLARNAAR